MTVWKKVHIEFDSMGLMSDVVDPEDALIGDIPDPDPGNGSLLASIFAPAYLEFSYLGAGQHTDIVFDKHLPNNMAGLTAGRGYVELGAQGLLGRESTNASAPWSWRLYMQGAYEGPVDGDGDPNPPFEDILLGATNRVDGGKYSFLFNEAIRDQADEFPGVFDQAYILLVTIAHEFGHQFGLGEDLLAILPHDLMESLPTLVPYLTPEQLRSIRRIGQAGHPLGYPSSK